MMRMPSVDMIADSLASFSLGRGDRSATASLSSPVAPQHLSEDSDYSERRVAVELNSETALPDHWEQFLDLKTGEIYYINFVTAVRTTNDPRATATTAVAYDSSYCMTPSSDDDDNGGYNYDDDDDSSSNFVYGEEEDPCISSISTRDASNGDSGDGKTLVAAGCKYCLMYFMVPKGEARRRVPQVRWPPDPSRLRRLRLRTNFINQNIIGLLFYFPLSIVLGYEVYKDEYFLQIVING